jgi:hypothetical protein
VTFVLTGLDIEVKAAWVRAQFLQALPATPAHLDWFLARTDHPDATDEQEASALLRCVAKDKDQSTVGRAFSAAAVELALASYPGFTMTAPPGNGTPYGVFTPAYVSNADISHTAVLPDGTRIDIPPPPETRAVQTAGVRAEEIRPASATAAPWETAERPLSAQQADAGRARINDPSAPGSRSEGRGDGETGGGTWPDGGVVRSGAPAAPGEAAAVLPEGRSRAGFRRAALGLVAGARSGDKGADANIGVWARTDAQWAWLEGFLTSEKLKELLPETRPLVVRRYVLANLRAVNFVVEGLLQEGVSSSTRFDPQGKALGEWLRSRVIDIPEGIL